MTIHPPRRTPRPWTWPRSRRWYRQGSFYVALLTNGTLLVAVLFVVLIASAGR